MKINGNEQKLTQETNTEKLDVGMSVLPLLHRLIWFDFFVVGGGGVYNVLFDKEENVCIQ